MTNSPNVAIALLLVKKFRTEFMRKHREITMVYPLVYRNTQTNLPNWNIIHDQFTRGYGYETDTHFVHFYGKTDPDWSITSGITVTEAKSGSLKDWCSRVFGAVDIEEGIHEVGTIKNVLWRPGILTDHEVVGFLAERDSERRLSEQAIISLLQRLDDLYFYIEPVNQNLNVYGHKIRDLLILSCTEVENCLVSMLRLCGITHNEKRPTTNDYVKLQSVSLLKNWEIALHRFDETRSFAPFKSWASSNPTQSLPWYDAYNKAKHDRSSNFSWATLEHTIDAVCACLVLYISRYGPYKIWDLTGSLSTIVNDSYRLSLINFDPRTVYLPNLRIDSRQKPSLIVYPSKDQIKERVFKP